MTLPAVAMMSRTGSVGGRDLDFKNFTHAEFVLPLRPCLSSLFNSICVALAETSLNPRRAEGERSSLSSRGLRVPSGFTKGL